MIGPEPVEAIRKRRGFTIAARGNMRDVVFPPRREILLSGEQVMLIDTEDDLQKTGLLGRLFKVMLPTVGLASGIRDPKWQPEKHFIAPQPGYPGVSFGYPRFYVTNSKPSIKRQLQRCLGHYNKNVKGHMFIGGEPVNFVTGELEADHR